MAEDRILVSVVIVNWNGQRYLHDLFTSLEHQTYRKHSFEVIMVDNNSTLDESVSYTRKNFPWVKIVESQKNLGFAGGNNLGIKSTKGKYIILLNNDTIVDEKWLEELADVADEKGAGAVVSKLMFAKKPGIINNAGSTLHPDASWPITEIGANEKDIGQYHRVSEITAFCGASVLLSRKMLQEIGLFDETFFMYFEDGDLSWRGQKAGWKYYFAPKSVVQHIHTGSSGENTPLFTYFVSRNRILILMKNAKVKVAARGYLAVGRDRIWLGLRQLVSSLRRGSGIKSALDNLLLGLKVMASATALIPLMIMRKYSILKEPLL